MKTIFTLLIITFFIHISHAQTEKGTINLGAAFDFSNSVFNNGSLNNVVGIGFGTVTDSDGEKYNRTAFNLTPGIGYFVIDNLMIRANIYVSSISEKSKDSDDEFKVTGLGFGPEVRYYIGDKKFKPYLGASSLFSSTTYYFDGFFGPDEEKIKSTTITGYIGGAYFIGANASIDVTLSYNNINYSSDDMGLSTEKANLINLGVGFNIFF